MIGAFVPRIAGFFEFAPVSSSVSARQKGGFDLLSLHREIPFLTESLDHIIVFSQTQLPRILKSYADYYNSVRTHRSLHKDAPMSRPIHQTGIIRSHPILGGLHHHYVRYTQQFAGDARARFGYCPCCRVGHRGCCWLWFLFAYAEVILATEHSRSARHWTVQLIPLLYRSAGKFVRRTTLFNWKTDSRKRILGHVRIRSSIL